MKLNKKGMTLVELIISVALLSVIVGFLYKILLDVKYESDDAGFAINNQVNRSEIIKTIQYDFEDLGVLDVIQNGDIITFEFNDEEKRTLEVNDTTLQYGSKKWTIKENNYRFWDIELDDSIEGYWKITIPVTSIDGTNESSIDDIILFTKYKEIKESDNNYPYLNDSIHANTTLVTTNPDFSKIATDTNTNIYQALDDYGTSYYFRGEPTNNYVKFGTYTAGSTVNGITYEEEKPMYWRIVRINGDGTIRMIYDGIEKAANGMPHYASIGLANYAGFKGPSAYFYLGYTYISDEIRTDSPIKIVVDSWYEKYFYKKLDSFIADSIFCNDLSTYTNTTENGVVDIKYSPYKRIEVDFAPDLTCSRYEDRYTTNERTGNGLLTYPVGLITVDELMISGSKDDSSSYNAYNYMGANEKYWTMSPRHWRQSYGHYYFFRGPVGNIGSCMSDDCPQMYVRPVINLKAKVKVSFGDGTLTNPYELVL